jgi:23S rRNA pseudouridine2605 synthase
MKRLKRKVSLARALSKLGVASRSRARLLIEEGRVTVNGRVLRNPDVRVDPVREILRVDDEKVRPAERVYLMMHKPKGVVTTRSDERGRETVYDLLQPGQGWLFPVGRLDRETSGLLLLTNDTQWGNRIGVPESNVPKVYHVKLDRPISEEDLRRLSAGVELSEPAGKIRTRPAEAFPLRSSGEPWLSLTIHEGRNRQVRRMCEALGYRVEELIRTRIGDLRLGDLPAGATRPLSADEVRSLSGRRPHSSRSW